MPFDDIVLPDALAGAVLTRQIEFLAGRYCAREALRRCAPGQACDPIGTGPNREPLWPPGMVGAITHTANFASVAVARSSDALGLGLDCEPWMDEAAAAQVRDSVAWPMELQTLRQAAGWPECALLTLVFSAKESVFKGFYPQVGRYFDYLDVSLDRFDMSPDRVGGARGIFGGRLRTALAPGLPAGHLFDGRFERRAGEICTAVLLAR